MTGCPCGQGWRVESAALGSGVIQAALPIVSLNVQDLLNGVGNGTFTMHPGDVTNLRHIWPHLTSLWVTYYDQFVWAGIIAGLSLQNGALSLGCTSLEGYLGHRKIRTTLTYTNKDQNYIGARLVEYQRTHYGIPLYGADVAGAYLRNRTYNAADRLGLMEQITALTEAEDGPEWRLSAVRAAGAWTATMTFADHWGVDTGLTLVSDVHAPDYGLEINTDSHATFVDALGSGGLIATASDPPYPVGTSPYVEFDEAPSFTDISVLAALQEQANGYLKLNKEPSISPRLTLTGTQNILGLGIQLGDTVEARMCFSGLAYEGSSRVIGNTWTADPDSATTRELMLSPNSRPSQTLLDLPPCTPCPDC